MKAFVAGVGMTPFGRMDLSLAELARQAARAALDDAGMEAPGVRAAVVGNAVQGAIDGQHGIRGQLMLRGLGLADIPVVNVENACASASTALHVATAYVMSGMADVALAVGAEKMLTADRNRSFDAFEGSWERADRSATLRRLAAFAAATPAREEPEAGGHSVFMDVYAAFARDHMARYGTTVNHLAAVSAKNHMHSVANPNAQFRRPFTVGQVLAAPRVVWPFTIPMCSAVSDGAAAAVIVSPEVVRRAGLSRVVGIRALELAHGGGWSGEHIDDHVSRRTARRLWEQAEVDPREVDVAEVHDATAIGEIQQIEYLGLVAPGEGGPAAAQGRTSIAGDIPVNPSGGLESRGHPIGATGLAQVFELVAQLRGEAGDRQVHGARIAVAENSGGLIGLEEAAVSMIVLEATR